MNIESKPLLFAINLILRLMPYSLCGVRIGIGSWIKSKTTLGVGTRIGWNFCVRGAGKLSIGRYCAIGENVRVITSNHAITYLALNLTLQSKLLGRRLVATKRDVAIGHDVWIGDGVIILPGVSIGNGAVIGAGSVVTKSIDAYSVVAGNPAKVIRARFPEDTIKKIESLAWWNWTLQEMKEKKHLFGMDLIKSPPESIVSNSEYPGSVQ